NVDVGLRDHSFCFIADFMSVELVAIVIVMDFMLDKYIESEDF
ncbi:pseudaminic acid synthase, partial [Campylobacter jejuni]|nr:pseudaminic acid synthase [Campylobacter jejuni]